MTDVREPGDDVVRQALAAEAEGVSADEAFAARVTAAVARDARRHRRRVGVLALAATGALVVGLAALLGRRHTRGERFVGGYTLRLGRQGPAEHVFLGVTHVADVGHRNTSRRGARAARARCRWVFTEPSLMPSVSATSRSDRSAK